MNLKSIIFREKSRQRVILSGYSCKINSGEIIVLLSGNYTIGFVNYLMNFIPPSKPMQPSNCKIPEFFLKLIESPS